MNLKMKSKRAALGLSQEELAIQIGISRQTIILIEQDKYNPSLKLCIAISKALNTTLDELFWGKKLMKDERIVSEFNKIKGYILVYMLIATILFGGLKFLLFDFSLNLYLVDLFVFTISFLSLVISLMIRHSDQYDERLQEKIGKIFAVGFAILLMGGLWVHMFVASQLETSAPFIGLITNTLILIGLIVLLILLKRKKLYANYKKNRRVKKELL